MVFFVRGWESGWVGLRNGRMGGFKEWADGWMGGFKEVGKGGVWV